MIRVSFVEYISAENKAAFEEAVRSDKSLLPGGYPEFRIYPEGQRDQYAVIKYIEPSDYISRMGFDYLASEERRKAMRSAVEKHEISATGPLEIQTENQRSNEPSFSLMIPVYKKASSSQPQKEEGKAVGFIAAGIHVGDLIKEIKSSEPFFRNIQYEIYDSTSPSDEKLIFSASREKLGALYFGDQSKYTTMLLVGGRLWKLNFLREPNARANPIPLFVLGAGTVFSFLVFAILLSLSFSYQRAEALTQKMSRTAKENERMYHQILDAIADMVIVKGPKSRIVWANKSFREYYGMTNDQLRGIIDAPFNEPDYTQQYVRDDDYVFKSGKTLIISSEPVTRFDGEVRYFQTVKSPILDEDGKVIMIVGVARDITETQQAEQALRRSEASLAEAQQLAHLGSWEWDARTKKVKWSQEMHRLFGVTPENFDGTIETVFELTHPEDRELVEASFREILEKGETLPIEYRIIRPDGGEKVLYSVGKIIRDDTGSVIKVVGTDQDITERKKWESRVLQFQKMESVGQLAAGVAHEINNPLAVILGFADGLLQRLQSNDASEFPLRSIVRETLRCKSLVQNLLTFSRESKSEKEEMDLNLAVEEALLLVQAQSRVTDIEIVKSLDPNIPKILANRNNIQQIVINLCTNAIDAMPEGGRLSVSTSSSRLNGAAAVEILVKDTGTGIPFEIQNRIFDPFFTTKPVGKGTGLGLSLVYELTQKHGGDIRLESAAGKGTEFRVLIPV